MPQLKNSLFSCSRKEGVSFERVNKALHGKKCTGELCSVAESWLLIPQF